MGGGALSHFGQAQAKVSDLALLAVSHLHPDHIRSARIALAESLGKNGSVARRRPVRPRCRTQFLDIPQASVRREERRVPGAARHTERTVVRWWRTIDGL